jgi:hypothetical protein
VDPKDTIKPTYAAVIPTKMFMVLLDIIHEFEDDLSEDLFKQVNINILHFTYHITH